MRSAGFPAADALLLSAPDLGAHADRLLDSGELSAEVLGAFRGQFASTMTDLTARVRDVVAHPRFRAAVTWQNHHVLRRGLLQVLQFKPGVDARSSKHRQREDSSPATGSGIASRTIRSDSSARWAGPQ